MQKCIKCSRTSSLNLRAENTMWLPTKTTTTQLFKESKTTIRRNVYNGWQPTNVNLDEWIVVSLLRTYHEMLTLTRLARPNEFQEIYTVVIQNFVLCFSLVFEIDVWFFFSLHSLFLYVECSDVSTISYVNGQTQQKGHGKKTLKKYLSEDIELCVRVWL